MSTTPDTDAATLLTRIRSSRAALEEVAAGLSDEQLAAIGPDGWSAKDHLVHVAAWEDYLTGLLGGRPGVETFGLEGQQAPDTDTINAIVQQRHAGLSAAEARQKFADSHAALMERLEALSDADVQRPISSYLPRDDEYADRPISGWIVGNTYEHYDEHREWIVAATT